MEQNFKEGDWAAYNWLTEPDENGKQEDNWKIGRIVKTDNGLMYFNDDCTKRSRYIPLNSGVKRLANDLPIADVSGSISVEDTVNAFLDWMRSDDCWIIDKDGKRIPDAEINGKNFLKYAEKYYR